MLHLSCSNKKTTKDTTSTTTPDSPKMGVFSSPLFKLPPPPQIQEDDMIQDNYGIEIVIEGGETTHHHRPSLSTTTSTIPINANLEYSLYCMTSDITLCIQPALVKLCKAIKFSSSKIQQATTTTAAPTAPPFYTWRALDAQFFSLVAFRGNTYVYCHENDMLYLASAMSRLSPSCPDETVFLGQFTVDTIDGVEEPRFLVFDIHSSNKLPQPEPRGEPKGEPKEEPKETPQQQRGRLLRTLSVHLPHPLCVVQWIGQRRCLVENKDFISSLPHPVDALLCLQKSPFSPILEKLEMK